MAFWSYSQLALYHQCPARFFAVRVEKRPGLPFDNRKAYIGHLLQKVVERFYAEQWWRDPTTVGDRMRAEIPGIGRQVTGAEEIVWGSGEEAKWVQVALETVPKIVEVIKTERLLSPETFAEYGLAVPFDGRDTVVGRADFIYADPSGALTVLDGKAGGTFGRYVHADQLRYYALGVLCDPRFRRLPTRVGFWWYRFGKIVWRPVNRKALLKFADGVKATIARVRAKDWAPTPGEQCHFCEVKATCEAGRAWLFRNSSKVPLEGNLGTVSL